MSLGWYESGYADGQREGISLGLLLARNIQCGGCKHKYGELQYKYGKDIRLVHNPLVGGDVDCQADYLNRELEARKLILPIPGFEARPGAANDS